MYPTGWEGWGPSSYASVSELSSIEDFLSAHWPGLSQLSILGAGEAEKVHSWHFVSLGQEGRSNVKEKGWNNGFELNRCAYSFVTVKSEYRVTVKASED